ncbi:uncharacterized protein LOC115449411 [Manduca sexta]|uniref:uncharacterized protein LOC115449411 n=1 Tax=Manduca sexta TaxID=7130 RepID=UPI00118348F6|nr:uncharacterized protein LOC115449411 [Manduca sexta]
MVLDKDYEKRKYTVRKGAPIPRLISEGAIPPVPSSLFSSTYSASAVADIETVTSLTPENTLSMVSTPWSTETWNTDQESLDTYASWLSTDALPASSLSPEPVSTSSYGVTSPYHSSSKNTLTLLSSAITPSTSRQMPLLHRMPECSETVSTWTMETFTSTGILSDANILRVQFPWSPCTMASESELYPSSLESYESRKVSRVSVTGTPAERDSPTPMNYNFHGKHDQDPIVDWLRVKLKGLGVVNVRV